MRISTCITGLVLSLGLGSAVQARQATVLEAPSAQLPLARQAKPDSVEFIPVETDELIQDRLSCLENEIPLEFNPQVRNLIDYFTIRNRKYTRRVLERQPVYFPMFEKYLAKHGMPDELKYLAVVESALLPKAVSSAKAVGLWQFMTPTANDFKLVQNSYLDERMDPEKSTEAACKFLKQLHRMFGSWEMALAAYNCGPGNVRKAIARSGGKKTFWGIYDYLPRETRNYVPTFTAIVYALNYAPDHNLKADFVRPIVAVDTLLINQPIDLKLLAKQLSLPENAIADLNPAVKMQYLPAEAKNYPLRIPASARSFLAENRMAILDSARYVAPLRRAAPASSTMVAKAKINVAPDSSSKGVYTVRPGDSLFKIAQEQNVTVEELKAWNQLKNTTLLAHQKLVIRKPSSENKTPQKVTEPVVESTLLASAQVVADPTAVKTAGSNANDAPAENVVAVTAAPKKNPAAPKTRMETPQTIHHVQPGDTLWNISRRYNNISVEQLRKANKLNDDQLKPGMKLIVG